MKTGSAVVVREKSAARLLEAEVITEAQIEQAKEQQKSDGGSLGLALMRIGAVDEKTYTEFLGKVYNLPIVDVDSADISPECIELIPADVATKFQVLPISRSGRILTTTLRPRAKVGPALAMLPTLGVQVESVWRGGYKVVGVDRNSVAEEIGLAGGDILRTVNGQAIENVDPSVFNGAFTLVYDSARTGYRMTLRRSGWSNWTP